MFSEHHELTFVFKFSKLIFKKDYKNELFLDFVNFKTLDSKVLKTNFCNFIKY